MQEIAHTAKFAFDERNALTTNFHLLWNVFSFTFNSNFVYIYNEFYIQSSSFGLQFAQIFVQLG
jgi:hypothetical protein